jgi:pyruvate formate lyase activating enzyme
MSAGTVFNVQRFSLHNGPGIRTTVFLKGCPLRCVWCHNPESQLPGRQVAVVESRCIACGGCTEVCPERIAPAKVPGLTPGRCRLCGACAAACPSGARALLGRTVGVGELIGELERDRVFYDESGGGATFSGGEPLAQADFVADCLDACRRLGVHTAVDTCGHAPWADLERVAMRADLVLYDLKTLDDERHIRATGASNRTILDNLRRLAAVHPAIWVRIPIVPGITDDLDELAAAAELVAGLAGVRQVNLLPYHRTGVGKHRRLGLEYGLENVATPPVEHLERLAQPFRAAGLATRIGG